MDLPRPRIERCFFDRCFEPPLPAMELDWAPHAAEHDWRLPAGITLSGPAPRRFGVNIHRHGSDAYQVRILWNQVFLVWEDLARSHILASSLSIILNSLGTDVWYLLNQEIEADPVVQAA